VSAAAGPGGRQVRTVRTEPDAAAGQAAASADLALVRARRLVHPLPFVRFALEPGDRALVEPGDAVTPGTPLAERLRDGWTEVIRRPLREAASYRPGEWWAGAGPDAGTTAGRRARFRPGELLFAANGRWRVATGDRRETLESPVAGIVGTVEPGAGIEVRATGVLVAGAEFLGAPVHGRMELLASAAGEVRSGSLDVGLEGRVMVVGSRIDSEALSRARATGVAGVVVASLGARERRDTVNSERRQRAGVQPPRPFGILILEGGVRLPVPSPVQSILESLAGRSVALLPDPPGLLVEVGPVPEEPLPRPRPDLVRIVAGPLAGREGPWGGLAGMRQVEPGVVADCGFVRIAGRAPVAVPLVALERFV